MKLISDITFNIMSILHLYNDFMTPSLSERVTTILIQLFIYIEK